MFFGLLRDDNTCKSTAGIKKKIEERRGRAAGAPEKTVFVGREKEIVSAGYSQDGRSIVTASHALQPRCAKGRTKSYYAARHLQLTAGDLEAEFMRVEDEGWTNEVWISYLLGLAVTYFGHEQHSHHS
jgi:hypothetical protein